MSRIFSIALVVEIFVVVDSCLLADTFFSHCSSCLLVLYCLFGFLALPLVLWVLGLLLWSLVWFEALCVGKWKFGGGILS